MKPDAPSRRARAGARSRDTVPDRDAIERVFGVVSRYFGLLSQPTRLMILYSVCHEEKSVSRIVAETAATQTNVSRHLALLHQAGMVNRRRVGATVYYQVADPHFVEICRALCMRIAGRMEAGGRLHRDLLHFAAAR